MTAFTGTPSSSLQYADQLTSQMADPVIGIGKLNVASFKYTHVLGAGTGAINLITLPGGLIRIFVDLCRIVSSAMVSTANLDIGYRAHTTMAGVAVAEDENDFEDDADAGSAIDKVWTLPAVGFKDLDSDGNPGPVIFVTIATANIEDTDTIDGYVTYAQVD